MNREAHEKGPRGLKPAARLARPSIPRGRPRRDRSLALDNVSRHKGQAVAARCFEAFSVPGALLGLVLVSAVGVAYAQDYAIDWHTIDSGGEMWSTGGTYELSGTISQSDAGEMSGGTYSLTGGFWFGCVPGDCDCDGDVDLHDFTDFEACLLGPGGGLGAGCGCFDLDGNGDVDLQDFAEFQMSYTG